MSQIETIMLVTLGFVVAALVALFFGRIIWSYAVTLGKRRTERSAPATIAGLQAERDQLRAEHAMLSRKLELRLEDLKTRLAEQTAEVSRNRNRIDHLITEVETRNATIAERDNEIEQLNRNFEPLETELATRTQIVQQLKEQLRDRDDEVMSLRHEFNEIASQAADRDREIALLRNELTNRPRHEDIRSEAQSASQRLKKQIEELSGLSRQISTQRSEISKQYDEFARLREEAQREDLNKPQKPSPPKGQADPAPEGDARQTAEVGSSRAVAE